MIIMHVAYITCLVTNDAWNASIVMVVYNIQYGAGRISYFSEQAILWLAGTLMGEVGAIIEVGGRACPLANMPIPWVRKNIVLINQ